MQTALEKAVLGVAPGYRDGACILGTFNHGGASAAPPISPEEDRKLAARSPLRLSYCQEDRFKVIMPFLLQRNK